MTPIETLLLTSATVAAIGAVICVSIAVKAYRRFSRQPSPRSSWMYLASLTLTWAMFTLFVSATGILANSGGTTEWSVAWGHLGLFMRGGLLALVIALWYGWRKIPELNGNGGH